MGSKDPRVDAYIAGAAPFAQPILARLRRVVHAGCPSVVETIKWGVPYFEHRGVLATMAAFRAHCTFEVGPAARRGRASSPPDAAARRFGRIARAADLPGDAALRALVAQAAARPASETEDSSP